MDAKKEYNQALCEMYPFLVPSNPWTGKFITEGAGYWPGEPEAIPEYDYEWTELDIMPEGWRKAFGVLLCDELLRELKRVNALEKYRINDIKEKYGSLRWYDNGNTREGYRIIGKYTGISRYTCIICGAPATRVTLGWYSPFCGKCCPDDYSVPVKEFWNPEDQENN